MKLKLSKKYLLFSALTLLASYAKAQFAFPYDGSYPYGSNHIAASQSQADSQIQSHWAAWQTNRLTTQGVAPATNAIRVLWSDNLTTISESMGYGMLLAEYMGNQILFDQLYAYVAAHRNGEGLMDWHLDQNGVPTTSDQGANAATDGDEDIAVALYGASIKWGASSRYHYLTEAQKVIGAIKNYEVVTNGGGNYLISDDLTYSNAVDSNTDPSYFSPAWYRLFQESTGDAFWVGVVSTCASTVSKAVNSNTGLAPDWCTSAGGASSGHPSNFIYAYDAFRVPWRQAVDYSWNGDINSKGVAEKIGGFFAGIGANNVDAERHLNGSVISGYNYQDACFESGATASLVPSDASDARGFYDVLTAMAVGNNYYSACWQLLGEIYVTGNLPNPDSWNFVKNQSFEQSGVQYSRSITEWTTSSPTGTSSASYLDDGSWKGKFMLSNWSPSSYSVLTSQTCAGLSKASYTLRAWVRSSGGLATANLEASGFDAQGTVLTSSFTNSTNSQWILVTVPNIPVSTGACQVSIRTVDTIGNHWVNVDDVILIKQ